MSIELSDYILKKSQLKNGQHLVLRKPIMVNFLFQLKKIIGELELAAL